MFEFIVGFVFGWVLVQAVYKIYCIVFEGEYDSKARGGKS